MSGPNPSGAHDDDDDDPSAHDDAWTEADRPSRSTTGRTTPFRGTRVASQEPTAETLYEADRARVGCVLKVGYRTERNLLISYCVNLSRGGLFVACRDPLPPGTVLRLAVEIPGDGERCETDAIVRWIRPLPGPQGPPGMGLCFEGLDRAFGTQIDRIVTRFTPLRIAIVGHPEHAWQHIASLVRTLVRSEVEHHPAVSLDPDQVLATDLVIVDMDAATVEGFQLLQELYARPNPPPRLALCAARALAWREAAAQLSRVIPTPVDAAELQSAILEVLCDVSTAKLEPVERPTGSRSPEP